MKLVLATLEEVAEPLRGEYESKDGKFHLKIEGDPTKEFAPLVAANAKIVEFRNNNIALTNEVTELRPLKAKYEGIDPDEAKKAIEKVKTFSKKGMQDADDLDARLNTMLEAALKPVKEQLAAAQTNEKAAADRANAMLFDSTVGDAAKLAGAQLKALKFLSGLAKDTFEIKDGTVVAKTGKFSKEKPGDPLTVEEWLKDQAVENTFAFEPSKGGGAGGAKPDAKPGQPVLKAGQTVLKNPTPQELGAAAKDIKDGKVKVVYDEETVTK
jgi:hypothetical protein